MTKSVPKKAITDLVAQVMRIQKKYAHEQVGVRNDRRNEVKKIVNRVASELENKDGN
jgi:low affinity Fe/Cu permease